MLLLDSAGPGGITVRVNTWERFPMNAETVTVPAVAPAVTVTFAWPLASVRTEFAEIVALPFTTKLIGWFDTGRPLVPLTCTISGVAKFCPDWAVCKSPDTFVREAIVTLVVRTKLAPMPLLLPVRAALTVIDPEALGAKVTVVCSWPTESVVVRAGVTVAKPAGETVQVTVVLAMVTMPEASVTLATRGAEVWPGLTL